MIYYKQLKVKMSKICLIAFTFILTFLAIGQINAEESNQSRGEVIGTVMRNSHSCAVDGICLLEVQKKDGASIEVWYGWEHIDQAFSCRADENLSKIAWNIQKGQNIEVKGLDYHQNVIVLCSGKSHSIKILSK